MRASRAGAGDFARLGAQKKKKEKDLREGRAWTTVPVCPIEKRELGRAAHVMAVEFGRPSARNMEISKREDFLPFLGLLPFTYK